MAKASTYRDIIHDIQKRKFAPVYLLMGDEPYYIDKIVEALEQTVIPEEDRDFNTTTFYGADVEMDVLIGSAQQLPMMSEYQLVLLKEAQGMRNAKNLLNRLAPYIEHANPQSILVVAFKGDNLSATSELMKVATKSDNAVVFKSAKLRDYQLSGPIKDYCKEKGIGIEDAAAQMLPEYVGSSLETLFGAIDKMIISMGNERRRINVDDITANIGVSKEYIPYELVTAIAGRNYKKAQIILYSYRQNPKANPTVVISAQLFNFFSKIVIAHLLRDKSDASLMKATDTKSSYSLGTLKSAIQKFSPRQAMYAISAIRDFDAKSKGIDSLQNEHALLSELVFTLFTYR